VKGCLIDLQLAPKEFRDDSVSAGIDGLQSKIWNLEQHGADVMGTLEDFRIDVHVIRQLTKPFSSLLLNASVHVSCERQALRK